MTSRLVLGSGSVAQAVVGAVADGPGTLTVLAGDESAVRTFREEGVAAEHGDVTDASVLAEHDAGTVVVATDDPARNGAAARAAREVFPDAFVLAYGGTDPPEDLLDTLDRVADRVVDPVAATAEQIGRAHV